MKDKFKETKEVVELISSSAVGRHIASISDVEYGSVKMIFTYIVEKILSTLMSGKVARVEGLGIFFLEVSTARFVFKHHYYGNCESNFSIKPCFRPNTHLVSKFTKELGEGVIELTRPYMPMIHYRKRIQYEILENSIERPNMEDVDAEIMLIKTKLKELEMKRIYFEKKLDFYKMLKDKEK
jgi:hypothetical protein